MAWHKKKPDPISDRARTLNGRIADLEAQIKRLDAQLQRDQGQEPRLRPTGVPQRGAVNHSSDTPDPTAKRTRAPGSQEPIFEEVDQAKLSAHGDSANTAGHYNDLGVRKYDLFAVLRRIRNHFRAPTTTNPKLVSYLAAGGIQGLRPLRYEKRVARNRFIALVILLFLMLLGLIWAFVHRSR